jgi:hypothetical protein
LHLYPKTLNNREGSHRSSTEDIMHALHSQAAVTLAGLIGLTSVFFVCRQVNPELAPVQFANAAEARDFFAANGLHCHEGTPGSVSGCGNYYVANHPISEDDTLQLAADGSRGAVPEWQGVLWVAQIRGYSGAHGLMIDSVRGKTRIWGNIVVAGDEKLMDWIEAKFHEE